MPKFKVYGQVIGSKYLGEFEAETQEQAIELASANASVDLCHQCAGEVDGAEFGEITAELAE